MSSSSHNYQNINELFGKYINIQKLSQKLEKKKYIVTTKKIFWMAHVPFLWAPGIGKIYGNKRVIVFFLFLS